MNEPEGGICLTLAYDASPPTGPQYDTSTGPMTTYDENGLPVGGKQDPPKPLNPQGLDSDDPEIIDRK